jgi:hypothetical protein
MARRFDGKSNYITMPNTAYSKISFPEKGHYSISAWVSVDTNILSHQVILSKGPTQYSLAIRDSFCAFTEFKNMVGWHTARSTPSMTFIKVPSTKWILVTGIREGDRQALYIDDGFCTGTTNEVVSSVRSRLTGFNLALGRIEDTGATASRYFGGMIDEVRIYNVALSETWVRLCFKNQIWDGRLVKFE